jgi:hypothetical protein
VGAGPGLVAADGRAVTLEVAFQNVALAIGMAIVFFPGLAGVAITSILWGVVHLTLGFALAAIWIRVPLDDGPLETTQSVQKIELPLYDDEMQARRSRSHCRSRSTARVKC